MRDHDQSAFVSGMEIRGQPRNPLLPVEVKAGGRLVEQGHLRSLGREPGKLNLALLAAGKLPIKPLAHSMKSQVANCLIDYVPLNATWPKTKIPRIDPPESDNILHPKWNIAGIVVMLQEKCDSNLSALNIAGGCFKLSG
jgi:hypothetical protein